MFKTLVIMGLLFSSAVMAQIGTSNTKIISLDSYNQYGNGDVLFRVETPVAECDGGYWLTKNDPGFNANLSFIISAYQAKNTVKIFGVPTQLWSGSSNKYCKLYSITLL